MRHRIGSNGLLIHVVTLNNVFDKRLRVVGVIYQKVTGIADSGGFAAQDLVGNGVEGAQEWQVVHIVFAEVQYVRYPVAHFPCRLVGKSYCQDIGRQYLTFGYQVSDTVSESFGFAATSSG